MSNQEIMDGGMDADQRVDYQIEFMEAERKHYFMTGVTKEDWGNNWGVLGYSDADAASLDWSRRIYETYIK